MRCAARARVYRYIVLSLSLPLFRFVFTDSRFVGLQIPAGDPQFDPYSYGNLSMPFSRSQWDPATGTSTANPRQQVNHVTAFIDGSMVYGSDDGASQERAYCVATAFQ